MRRLFLLPLIAIAITLASCNFANSLNPNSSDSDNDELKLSPGGGGDGEGIGGVQCPDPSNCVYAPKSLSISFAEVTPVEKVLLIWEDSNPKDVVVESYLVEGKKQGSKEFTYLKTVPYVSNSSSTEITDNVKAGFFSFRVIAKTALLQSQPSDAVDLCGTGPSKDLLSAYMDLNSSRIKVRWRDKLPSQTVQFSPSGQFLTFGSLASTVSPFCTKYAANGIRKNVFPNRANLPGTRYIFFKSIVTFDDGSFDSYAYKYATYLSGQFAGSTDATKPTLQDRCHFSDDGALFSGSCSNLNQTLYLSKQSGSIQSLQAFASALGSTSMIVNVRGDIQEQDASGNKQSLFQTTETEKFDSFSLSKQLIVGVEDSRLRVYNAKSGSVYREWSLPGAIQNAVISEDGTTLAVAFEGGARVYDLVIAGSVPKKSYSEVANHDVLALSNNGRYLVRKFALTSRSGNQTTIVATVAEIVDLARMEVIKTLRTDDGSLRDPGITAKFSPTESGTLALGIDALNGELLLVELTD